MEDKKYVKLPFQFRSLEEKSSHFPLGEEKKGTKKKGTKKRERGKKKGKKEKGNKKGGKKGTKGMVEKKGKGKMGGNGKLEASEVTSSSMSKSQLKSN